nr:hypothetical protein GTC16762_33330 [Pigmentibacter ruber]
MNLTKKEKLMIKKYFNALFSCICSFASQEKINEIYKKCKTYPEIILLVADSLKTKEAHGWMGEDLKEDQMNVLTLISEMYLKRNKSKYKTIEKPSEILSWFSILLENSLLKSEIIVKRK